MDKNNSDHSQYFPGDIAWVLASTALVWLMIPGVGYFYAGMARTSRNALAMIMCSVLCLVVVTCQWFIWGYSLCFSKTASYFIGNLDNALLRNVLGDPSIGSEDIPDLIFMIFQCMFASLTPALAIGSAASRARLFPLIVFVFIWSTLVYDVIACWTWNPNGWSYKLGVLDFAGGTPVHITSGFASLAYALIIGRGITDGQQQQQLYISKPQNMSNLITGCAFLWFGWFGFNGGSALSGTLRAGMAVLVTNLAASVGALAWMGMDYWKQRKFSALSFCSGAVAGLVAITPAAGFVGPGPAVAIGFLAGVGCNCAAHLKHWLNFDDVADVFAIHGVGGYLGSVLTGVFAEKYIAGLDDMVIDGGWLNQNWIQVPHQMADATAGACWSFCMTYLILLVMDRIPGLSMRVPREDDIQQFLINQNNQMNHDNSNNAISFSSDQKSDHHLSYYHIGKVVTINQETGEQRIVRDDMIEMQRQQY
ncbi:ammonium transporter AmtB-like domain-containing protein [Halteromyces radiatus]|uniref:ammonium transporter AmtB-like domain-containing protein n=1 Tax=Halteromyces radiatus TaxID=101107 RepID=UPI00221EDAE1|nr:ammonium transporter AmtB-like domain-containing protein [Halteromyces radiatus]KAI8097263.1 ammonium transporter AmtB-like domain-containing protein [Halteromyces radiatus]